MKTCFVIMGFGIKNGIDLDYTYNEIIKPCINKFKLQPFPLFEERKFNAFRCDEICGSGTIDFRFVTCLNGADIVIADISTMNINAIYELGARHALKPRSTILLCAKEKKKVFNFFDLTYVPIIFYEHSGNFIKDSVKIETQKLLNKHISFAIDSNSQIPDNPIQRALKEQILYNNKISSLWEKDNSYQLYNLGKKALNQNDFKLSIEYFTKLYEIDNTEDNLLLLALAKYKYAEQKASIKDLIDCYNLIIKNIDVYNSLSETVYGRLAAISIRIYNLNKDISYYYKALEFYGHGSIFSNLNYYCPRNYCSNLMRIYEITDDLNIIKEYYYTAKHFAKFFLNLPMQNIALNYEQRIYAYYNRYDLQSIVNGEYIDYELEINKIRNNLEITKRQKETLLKGISKAKEDLLTMERLVKFS